MNISLNSVVGITNPNFKTMKLAGNLRGRKVILMIDPGVTHNFVSPKVVEKMGIECEQYENFGVV